MSNKGREALRRRAEETNPKQGDTFTKPAVPDAAPSGEITHALADPAPPVGEIKPLSEVSGGEELRNLRGVELKAVELGLWETIDLGGGDVAMLCKFTEQQFNLLTVRADETGMTIPELLADVFMRLTDNVWV